jgi:hypothetical protein
LSIPAAVTDSGTPKDLLAYVRDAVGVVDADGAWLGVLSGPAQATVAKAIVKAASAGMGDPLNLRIVTPMRSTNKALYGRAGEFV